MYLLETTHPRTTKHCIHHITNIPHSVLIVDMNAHSTLWHSYTDHHRGQLIVDVIRHYNTKHRLTNQSAEHHTATTIFNRYHRVFRSDHNTHQHTHFQLNVHKHHGKLENFDYSDCLTFIDLLCVS